MYVKPYGPYKIKSEEILTFFIYIYYYYGKDRKNIRNQPSKF